MREKIAGRVIAVLLLAACVVVAGETLLFSPVSREVIEARLGRYKGGDQQREVALKEMFKEVGCDGERLSEQKVEGYKLPNVICTLPGTSDRVVIVGAHYDHAEIGEGVIDNWSGASLLPSLYQAVKGAPRTHSFIFIGFSSEERGLRGSRYYAEEMTKEQVAATSAMVNLDTLGLGPAEVWTSHSDKNLTDALLYIAGKMKIPAARMDLERVGADSMPFEKKSIPSITIHSLTAETWNAGILHSLKDNSSAMRMDDYYQTYRLLAAYLAYLDR
jgi:Zn-dependent M28 family amino/carboxypeptidase